MGAVHCTKAVWEIMRAQNYGRIVMTTSSSGLYGNFGQANYGAAKMALVGLMQTLSIEGAKHDIRVNCLAPTAATRMTEKPAARVDAAPARAGGGDAGPARAGRRRRADARDPLRRRGLVRARPRHADRRASTSATTPTRRSRSPRASHEISDRDGETVPESGAAQGDARDRQGDEGGRADRRRGFSRAWRWRRAPRSGRSRAGFRPRSGSAAAPCSTTPCVATVERGRRRRRAQRPPIQPGQHVAGAGAGKRGVAGRVDARRLAERAITVPEPFSTTTTR